MNFDEIAVKACLDNGSGGGDPDPVDHGEAISLSVTPSSGATVTIGSTTSFASFVTYEDGYEETVTTSSAWTSSDTSHATIGAATGVATGVGSTAEDVTVTATYLGLSDTAPLHVTPVITYNPDGFIHTDHPLPPGFPLNGDPIIGGDPPLDPEWTFFRSAYVLPFSEFWLNPDWTPEEAAEAYMTAMGITQEFEDWAKQMVTIEAVNQDGTWVTDNHGTYFWWAENVGDSWQLASGTKFSTEPPNNLLPHNGVGDRNAYKYWIVGMALSYRIPPG